MKEDKVKIPFIKKTIYKLPSVEIAMNAANPKEAKEKCIEYFKKGLNL